MQRTPRSRLGCRSGVIGAGSPIRDVRCSLMQPHIISHVIAALGWMLMLVAPLVGRTRSAPISIRLPLILFGVVGIAWSSISIYLYSHDRDATHTLLPLAQHWALSHLKSELGGVVIGILTILLANRDFYRRKHMTTAST